MSTMTMALFFPLFLYSVILHEVAHGYVALRNGDPTAKLKGRLTFNPIPHIDPIGTLFFIISAVAGAGFGWARPVPINPFLFRDTRRGILQVSLAGVGMNMLIAVLAVAAMKVIFVLMPDSPVRLAHPANFLDMSVLLLFLLAQLNVVLAVLNLMPIPPLDGSRVVMVLLPKELGIRYAKLEPVGFFLLLLFLYAGGFDFVYRISKIVLGLLISMMGKF